MAIICMMFMIRDISADNEDTKRKLPASRLARSSQRRRSLHFQLEHAGIYSMHNIHIHIRLKYSTYAFVLIFVFGFYIPLIYYFIRVMQKADSKQQNILNLLDVLVITDSLAALKVSS